MKLLIPDYPNPYRESMARYTLEVSPSGDMHYVERGGNWSCTTGEKGMRIMAAIAVDYDEHIEVLMEWLHVRGAELCTAGVPLAFHEWSLNDYCYIPGEDPPVFDLQAWHGDRYCIAYGYETLANGSGRFFDWHEGRAAFTVTRFKQ